MSNKTNAKEVFLIITFLIISAITIWTVERFLNFCRETLNRFISNLSEPFQGVALLIVVILLILIIREENKKKKQEINKNWSQEAPANSSLNSVVNKDEEQINRKIKSPDYISNYRDDTAEYEASELLNAKEDPNYWEAKNQQDDFIHQERELHEEDWTYDPD